MRPFLSVVTSALCLGLVLTSAQVIAKAPVWKVSKGGHHLYLGGTIHVLSQADYPLPSAFKEAFSDSAKIIFETDMAAMTSPEAQAKMRAVILFQDQRKLHDVLSKSVYKQLEDFLAVRQIPVANFSKFTPAGISLTLTLLELQRLGLTSTAGVDAYYSMRAKDEGKSIGMLESVDEQIAFIASMNDGDANEIVASSLRDLEDFGSIWKNILSAWRSGNTKALSELTIAPMRDEFPEFYQTFLVKRNNAWIEKIKPMLNDRDIEFLLVGYAHMVGEDGLLTQLKDAGYKIDQM